MPGSGPRPGARSGPRLAPEYVRLVGLREGTDRDGPAPCVPRARGEADLGVIEAQRAALLSVSSVNDTREVGELSEVNITTPSKSSWHLSNLSATTKYKFYVRACTSQGCGKPVSEEGATLGEGGKHGAEADRLRPGV